MLYDRNFRYLHNNRIVYRKYPDQDPTETHRWGFYYADGTYECYELFRSKAKINTYKSLKWHLLVLWYLNPSMDPDDFNGLASFIVNKRNGFTTFNVYQNILDKIIYEVSMCDLDEPPKNKMRKIIFKDMCGLSTLEKLRVVGEFVGKSKRITEDNIYETMLSINDEGKKITVYLISKVLKCSTRTIYRNMSEDLKREKELLNKEL